MGVGTTPGPRAREDLSLTMYEADTCQGRGSHRWSLSRTPLQVSGVNHFIWSQRTGDAATAPATGRDVVVDPVAGFSTLNK